MLEKFIEKHADYISLFDKDIIEYEDSIEEFISAIFNKIDVREQEHLMDRIKLVHTMLFPDKKDYSFMCAELLSGVMHTYYRDKKKFCAWLENFNNILETGNNPPFANFFQNKFANMSQKIFDTFESNGVITGYEVLRTNNLYSAIAFIWVPLTLDNAALNKTVYVSEYDVRSVWESNIEELKQFVELFRIIR